MASALLGFVAFASTGCVFFTKSDKQMVVVRSSPEGAVTKINGIEVGTTPLKVQLPRDEVFRIDVEKNGFASESSLVLPSSYDYDQRYLRWGVDYDTGAALDLVPGELSLTLQPELAQVDGTTDRFTEMSAQITRADAMLASGELTVADHKNLVGQILAAYKPSR